jgi:hypothetical protein
MKIVIIGGVAGGATTAARIRRVDETAQIVLLERGKYISYANCGLPYYIGNTIKEREKLFVQTPEAFSKRFMVDVRTENEVVAIDKEQKQVIIKRKDGSQYNETYDRLVISTGAAPVRPPLQGIDSEGIFTLRNVNDTDKIKAFIDSHDVKRAVVVGLTRSRKSANHHAEFLLAAPQLLIALTGWSSGSSLPSYAVVSLSRPPLRRSAITVMHSSLYRSTVLRVFLAVCSGCQDRYHPLCLATLRFKS